MPAHLDRIFFLTALCLALGTAAYHFHKREQKLTATPSGYSFSTDVNQALLQLKTNQRADIFRELDVNSQELMIKLVREHCSRKYDAESCLHYSISCGRPCLAYLNRTERKRMLASYEKIKKTVRK